MFTRGRDINICIERDGDFVFTACATNCSIERTAEEINITTADSGKENEYVGGATDASITLDGVITVDELGGFQYEEWVAAIGSKVNMEMDFTNQYGDRLRYTMSVLVTAVGAQGDANDFGMFNITMKRSGAETVSKIFDNILVDLAGDPILTPDGKLIRV